LDSSQNFWNRAIIPVFFSDVMRVHGWVIEKIGLVRSNYDWFLCILLEF
jgi:hypothetical protein